jgi:hypothetical protein
MHVVGLAEQEGELVASDARSGIDRNAPGIVVAILAVSPIVHIE